LVYAAKGDQRHVEVLELLLKSGANAARKDEDGHVAMFRSGRNYII
jgi:ankyrin repeat protein